MKNKIDEIVKFDFDETRDKDILDGYSRIALLLVNLENKDDFEPQCGRQYRITIEEI